jgi:hypothetical protein
MEDTKKVSDILFKGSLLECYGCLLVGDYDVFGLPTQCPECGSREIWEHKGN